MGRDRDYSETVEVDYPTPGRIVHLRIDAAEDEVLRPAIVLGRGKEEGFVLMQVFLFPTDVTDMGIAPGSRIFQREACPGFFAAAPFGTECGNWRWPEQVEEPESFLSKV